MFESSSEGPTRRRVLRGIAAGTVVGTLESTREVRASRGERFEVGVGRQAISPTPAHLEDGVYLAGYGVGPQPSRRATGIHDDIQAKAVAITAGDETVVVSRLDLIGLGNRQLSAIRRRAAERTGLDPRNVLVGATHTHQAPDFQGLWGGVPEAYREYVVERAVEAIAEAVADRRPGAVHIGTTTVPDLAENRRGWPRTDALLTAIQLRAQGRTVATVVNFAVHPTVMGSDNRQVSTDFVGPFERAVSANQGGVTVFVNGDQGDAVPVEPDVDGDFERAERFGERLADRVEEAVSDTDRVAPELATRHASVRLPIDNCLFKAGFETGLMRPYYSGETVTGRAESRAVRTVEGVSPALADRLRSVTDRGSDAGALAITSPVARVRLGTDPRVELFTIPGEAVTQLGDGLRAMADGDYTVPLGLTQNSLGYIIPQSSWATGRNGNYEETVSLGYDTAPIYRNGLASVYDERDGTGYARSRGRQRVCPDEQARFEARFGDVFTEAAIRQD